MLQLFYLIIVQSQKKKTPDYLINCEKLIFYGK